MKDNFPVYIIWLIYKGLHKYRRNIERENINPPKPPASAPHPPGYSAR
jgi:hypothetical protein